MIKAKWIWSHDGDRPDEYVRFYDTFRYNNGKTELAVSADSNYELYINGSLAAFGQYSDYPYDKVYDRIDVTPYCKAGENTLCILVWYYGVGSMTYFKGLPGVIYELTNGDDVLCASGKTTLCEAATDYVAGRCKFITTQMGLSYTYDSRNSHELPIAPSPASELSGRPEKMRPRPNKKIQLEPFSPASLIDAERMIYDLGRETVGYLGFTFKAPAGALVTVSYGEYISFPGDGASEYLFACQGGDAGVRRNIHNRDFSFEFYGNGDTVRFSNFMRRLGCRYLQIHCDSPVEVTEIGLYPAFYPLNIRNFKAENALRQRIYDTCVRTLRLCMFEHYEDCPWREQALYTLDSRNQMLCGYYAFGEYGFPRSVLELIGSDFREDGLLHICAPSAGDLVIPFFSLIYILEMHEYMTFSGDTELIRRLFEKMRSIISVFTDRMEDGLVPQFHSDRRYWNFYEWNTELKGDLGSPEEKKTDIILNAMLSVALDRLADIAEKLGNTSLSKELFESRSLLNRRINEVFLRPDGLYRTFSDGECVTELANAFAILCGAADSRSEDVICSTIVSGKMPVPTTLSMRTFKYDAMLLAGGEKYRGYILSEIDRVYGYMLNCGATSFWETEKGAHDFDGAGSLCHGWSAIPVMYLSGHIPTRCKI